MTQFATWKCGGVFIPLATAHVTSELCYSIKESNASVVIVEDAIRHNYQDFITDLIGRSTAAVESFDGVSIYRINPEQVKREKEEDDDEDDDAMMLFTSGTTGKPKGVVLTHTNITSMVSSLSLAWRWSSADSIMNVLPLHHMHGTINVVACALFNGARLEMSPDANPSFIVDRIVNAGNYSGALSLFMAVPTVYSKILHHLHQQRIDPTDFTEACKMFRLMVSGSAALPERTLEEWRRASGHFLLERYGMTEIGMALSNLIEDRRVGWVGRPLPFVQVKIDAQNQENDGAIGELLVKGPLVFRCYYRREADTKKNFDEDGWFKTGDIAERSSDGFYRILGRASTDIIKSAGYKLSAIEIENAVMEHDNVKEVAVVGVADEEYGEKVAAIVVWKDAKDKSGVMSISQLRDWVKLAKYKKPSLLFVVDALPRNAMGKINKKSLLTDLGIKI